MRAWITLCMHECVRVQAHCMCVFIKVNTNKCIHFSDGFLHFPVKASVDWSRCQLARMQVGSLGPEEVGLLKHQKICLVR